MDEIERAEKSVRRNSSRRQKRSSREVALDWCAFCCAAEVGEMLWCSRWLLRRPRGLTAFSAWGLFVFPASSSGGQGLRKG
ncbi:hypothetical protein BDV27DRAFT_103588 [Aspergillus caelatus]|uniref:Uncharacterized protein n=1 Tax=Aspergillus caelatus TaxID=61420 RepID=A0A5N7A9Y0_9EURO|nr:uncharacterized protein BDV27DRAFT_103588 [Aspergillus caelatus]KAE8365400.1 hypothetical protein BDV27DRAFT_103588 [Aspergillus caelatus]